MAVVRALLIQLGLKDDASGQIEGIDESVSGMRDNIAGTQDNVSDLTDETSEFGYSATRDMQDVGSQTGELENQTRSLGDRFRGVADSIGRNWNAIAAGAAGAGAALEGIIRSQQDLELQTDQVAIAMGESNEAVRGMISGMTDYTFSTDDALSGAQRLIQSGYDQEEQLKDLLPLFDEMADATGIDIVEGIDMVDRAFSAMGIPLTEVGDHLDTFTWLQTQTTVGMREFGQLMRREASTIRDMGLEVDEVAVAMAALESEGIRGPRMVMAFQEALEDAEGSSEAFWQELNVSSEALDTQMSRLSDADGLTRQLADANADNYTWLQKMHSELMETSYAYGNIISDLDFLSSSLTGLGTVMGIAAGAKYLLGAAALATGGVIIGVAAAVIGAGWLLYENWSNITEWLGDRWDTFSQRLDDNLEEIRGIPSELYGIGKDMLQGLSEGIDSGIDWLRGSIRGVRDTIVGGITDFFGISSPSQLMMEYGINMGEGLNLGLIEESKNMLEGMSRSFAPERDGQLRGAGGPSISIGDIYVQSNASEPGEVAQEVKRTLRGEFSREADRYFARKRRKKPR